MNRISPRSIRRRALVAAAGLCAGLAAAGTALAQDAYPNKPCLLYTSDAADE